MIEAVKKLASGQIKKVAKQVLLLIDIQKEYTTPGRPFYLEGIAPSLAKCAELLKLARRDKWEIIHVLHSNGDAAPRFNPQTEFFDFVAGFEPKEDEKVVIKHDFSCYSSADFSSYMDLIHASTDIYNVHLIGYNSVMCCLSTLEESRRKGHRFSFVQDASWAKAQEGFSESVSHQFMQSVYRAKNLANMLTSEEIFRANHLPSKILSTVGTFALLRSSVINDDHTAQTANISNRSPNSKSELTLD